MPSVAIEKSVPLSGHESSEPRCRALCPGCWLAGSPSRGATTRRAHNKHSFLLHWLVLYHLSPLPSNHPFIFCSKSRSAFCNRS